jgi:large subunit ribosomal protein L13e
MKGNHVLPNIHCHKDWQFRVRVKLNQAKRKEKRRAVRKAKTLAKSPRPLNTLRPQVHAPTQRYNTKIRLGRGFTLEELKEAKLTVKDAKARGISVDYRRRNKSQESLMANKERLEAYKSRLVMNPKETVANAVGSGIVSKVVIKPVASKEVKLVTITDAMRKVDQVRKAKQLVATVKLEGKRRFQKDEEEKKDEGKKEEGDE